MNTIDLLKGATWLAMLAYASVQFFRHYPRTEQQSSQVTLTAATPASQAGYQQAAESMRHYANLRFAQLTVLVATASAFFVGLTLTPMGPYSRNILELVALLATAAFLVMQERAADQWKHAFRAATGFETQWGIRVFRDWKEARVLTATNAVRVLHLLIGFLWLLFLG